jgi:tetratricopeptide (TPR) repeat protein
MKIKSLLTTVALLAIMSLSALAQVGRMEGEVLNDAGQPIVGADVQIHRNDIKWSANLKTDKKGKFIHAGIQYGGTYTVIIGADGYAPGFSTGHKPDQPIPPYKLATGDGKRLTLEDVRKNTGATGGGAPTTPANSAAAKKAEEEYNKKKAEIENKNKKAESDNKVMNDALAVGKTLMNNKDYGGALAEFEKGLAIDPEQNLFWYYKGLALFNQGVTKLNESIAIKDDPAKTTAVKDVAKANFTEAIAAASKSIPLLDASVASATGSADAAKTAGNKSNKYAYLKVRADSAGLIGERFFDPVMAEAANKDYIAMAELTDNPEEKKKTLFRGAEALRLAGAYLPSQNAYKAIIALDPNYAEAYYGMGLSFFSDEKTYQDGANYLQFFIDKAAPNDSRIAEAKASITQLNLKPSKTALDALKKDAGVKPTPTGKKKN